MIIWEITIFLLCFAGDNPRNPQICKSQREITIFLLFWSGNSLFSCFFWQATTLETRKSANHNGRSLFSCFFGVENHYFLAFFGRRQPSKPGNLQITVGDHYFLAFLEWKITIFLLLKPGNLQITTGDHYFLAFLESEITIFLRFLEATTLETWKSANHNGRSGDGRLRKKKART